MCSKKWITEPEDLMYFKINNAYCWMAFRKGGSIYIPTNSVWDCFIFASITGFYFTNLSTKKWCFIVLICVSLIIHDHEPFLPHVQLASYEDYCGSISILDLLHLFYCARIMFFRTLFIAMSLPFF